MEKAPDAFRTIGEVAEWLETPAHVLRFWESRFPQVKPVKRAGGRRYYRREDMALLGGIKHLLHDEGLSIRAVQQVLAEKGTRHVAGFAVLPAEMTGDAVMEGRAAAGSSPDASSDAADGTAPDAAEPADGPDPQDAAPAPRGAADIPPENSAPRGARATVTGHDDPPAADLADVADDHAGVPGDASTGDIAAGNGAADDADMNDGTTARPGTMSGDGPPSHDAQPPPIAPGPDTSSAPAPDRAATEPRPDATGPAASGAPPEDAAPVGDDLVDSGNNGSASAAPASNVVPLPDRSPPDQPEFPFDTPHERPGAGAGAAEGGSPAAEAPFVNVDADADLDGARAHQPLLDRLRTGARVAPQDRAAARTLLNRLAALRARIAQNGHGDRRH